MRTPDQKATDEELACAARGGSVNAFEELVARYEHRVFGFVANSCRDERDGREITQDTFVRAFHSLDRFDPKRSFATWLFTIARRRCIDHHRVPHREAESLSESIQDRSPDPAGSLAGREEAESLWLTARRTLPLAQFQALWLRYAEDMDVREIARALGKSSIHVKVLLFRARQRLARLLPSVEGGAEPKATRVPNSKLLVGRPVSQT